MLQYAAALLVKALIFPHFIPYFFIMKSWFVYWATGFTHEKRLQYNPTFYSSFFLARIPRVSRRFSSKYCCYIDIFCKNILDFFYLAASNVCLYTLASNEEVQTAICLSFDHTHKALKSAKKSAIWEITPPNHLQVVPRHYHGDRSKLLLEVIH